jgi:hypothetical protein
MLLFFSLDKGDYNFKHEEEEQNKGRERKKNYSQCHLFIFVIIILHNFLEERTVRGSKKQKYI